MQVASAQARAAAVALDAATAVLHVLASPGLPTALYVDELLAALGAVAKAQLQLNVLPFYDVRLQRQYRPSLAGVAAAAGVLQGGERLASS